MCAPCCVIICGPNIAIAARALAASVPHSTGPSSIISSPVPIAANALADTLDKIAEGLAKGLELGNFSGEEDMIFAAAESQHPWIAEIDSMRAGTTRPDASRLDAMKSQALESAREIVLASQKRLTSK